MHLLPFQSAILNELRQDDSLIVLARGLGVEQLLYHLIRVECAQSNKLVIVLNLSEEQRRFINDALLNDAYSRDRGSAASSSGAAASPDASPQTPERSPSYSPSESPSPPALPSNAHSFRPLRQLTSEFTSAERHLAYIEGGCIAVTNRIFVVDLLTKNIDVDLVDGIIVNNAHQVNDMTIEAFILRIYCQQQVKHGWIKACAGRTVTAYSLLSIDELPYAIDLHLFLGRKLQNQPEPGVTYDVHDAQQVYYGSLPTHDVELLNETVQQTVADNQLERQYATAERAYKLYYKCNDAS